MKNPEIHVQADGQSSAGEDPTPAIYDTIKSSHHAYMALSSVIESAQNDRATLRRFVYDSAWKMFAREAEQRGTPFTSTELLAGARALAEAIERLEVKSAHESKTNDVPRIEDKTKASESSVTVYEPTKGSALDKRLPAAFDQNEARSSEYYSVEDARPKILSQPRRVWLWYFLWPFLQLMGGVVIAVSLFAVIHFDLKDEITRLFEKSNTKQVLKGPDAKNDLSNLGSNETLDKTDAGKSSGDSPLQPRLLAPGLPLPTEYGVYAVTDGVLHALEPLAMRVPDVRILLSAEIDKPSQTILPDGKIMFLVFRRELENRAPDKLPIRVVAHVARSISYRSGNAAVTKLNDVWRIRANSYNFSVGPIAGNREIIAVRSEKPDFSLPAGRYVLVFNNVGYDFSVAGKVTVAEQCIESTETANGTIYSECRNP